jgi:hypothetical protein
MLAVLAEIRSVGVKDRSGVVVDPGDLLLVHREHENQAMLSCHVRELSTSGPVRNGLGELVPLRVLVRAKVRPVEELL